MATVQEWVDSIRTEVPEPLDSAVARQVRFAIQEFFRASESWHHMEPFINPDGLALFESLPANTYIASIKYVMFFPEGRTTGYTLTSTLEERLVMGSNLGYYAHTSGMDGLAYDGTEKGRLMVKAILQPNREIDEIPYWFADRWFDVIRRGAMARLLSNPDAAWSNMRAADRYEGHFREGIAKAKREARGDRSRPKRSVQFNKGFAW